MDDFIRPKAVILESNSIIPEKNIISPAPNQFTHVTKESQPYYFIEVERAQNPDGEFKKDTRVILLKYDGGEYCWVANEQGLYVEVDHKGLRPLH